IQNNPIQAKVYQELDGLPTWDGNYGIVAEVIGLADGHRCFAMGDISGCAWLAIGLTPVKPLKWLKMIFFASKLNPVAVRIVKSPWRKAFCSFSGDTHVLVADGTTKPSPKSNPATKS